MFIDFRKKKGGGGGERETIGHLPHMPQRGIEPATWVRALTRN